MSKRSYGNDRYRKGAKVGSTRKSAAAAKPHRAQGAAATPSSKKKSSGVEKDWTGLPTSPQIKKWQRAWFWMLAVALALAVASLTIQELKSSPFIQMVTLVVVFALSAGALLIDLLVVRKLRKALIAQYAPKKKTADKS